MLSVINIVEGTSVDGPGLRTSIYFAGCNHRCPGCHNQQTWDIGSGKPTSFDEILRIVRYNEFPVTFSGGDPFFQAEEVAQLAQRIHAELGLDIWCYTGYIWEQVIDNPQLRPLLENIDVLVDGPFVQSLRDTSLLFRGSSNQRIIDVPRSLAEGHAVVLEEFN